MARIAQLHISSSLIVQRFIWGGGVEVRGWGGEGGGGGGGGGEGVGEVREVRWWKQNKPIMQDKRLWGKNTFFNLLIGILSPAMSRCT